MYVLMGFRSLGIVLNVFLIEQEDRRKEIRQRNIETEEQWDYFERLSDKLICSIKPIAAIHRTLGKRTLL